MNTTTPEPSPAQSWAKRALSRSFTHVLVGLGVLLLDLLTGPFLLFPILFVLPVSLCAWFSSPRWAYVLAVFLPFGRFLIAVFVDKPAPFIYMVANALIRVSVLLFMAFLVSRTARQSRALEKRVDGLVTMCSWSRTIEYQGEWISFEQYLKRRFDLDTSHGISPTEEKKFFADLKINDPKA